VQHLGTLHEVCEKAVKASAGKASVEDEGDWKVVCIALGEFPIGPSIVSGDLIHNLRSSLDHLAWQLVKVSESEPGGWTYFPIYWDEDDFIRDVKKRAKKRGPGPLDGIEVDGPIWALIESYQPYKNTKLPPWLKDPMHPRKWMSRLTFLGIINALSRIDKHRTIHGFNVYPSNDKPIIKGLTWNSDAVLVEQRDRESFEPLEDGAELARFRFRPGIEPNVRMTRPVFLKAGFEAEFGHNEGVTILTDGMVDLIEGVEEILTSFKQFFPE
jgi:hypothetical protein